jgi:hypothetical protein
MHRRIPQEHPQLTVVDLPGGAGVLPLHPRRPAALLDEPGLIHHQHRTVIPEPLGDVTTQVITGRVDVPAIVTEQPLHPLRIGIPGKLRDRPAVLPLALRQQPEQIPARA